MGSSPEWEDPSELAEVGEDWAEGSEALRPLLPHLLPVEWQKPRQQTQAQLYLGLAHPSMP